MRRITELYLTSMLNRKAEVWGNTTSTEKNRLGQYNKEDKKLFEVYCAILPQTGGLLNGRQADTTLCRTTHKIVCRYNKNITSANWFIYDGVRYDILYIMDPYLEHNKLECYCEVVL